MSLPHQTQWSSGAEERMELASALSALGVRLREAFMLVEWLGLSAEEAGQILGIQPSSVRSRIHRARAVLREYLLDEEQSVE